MQRNKKHCISPCYCSVNIGNQNDLPHLDCLKGGKNCLLLITHKRLCLALTIGQCLGRKRDCSPITNFFFHFIISLNYFRFGIKQVTRLKVMEVKRKKSFLISFSWLCQQPTPYHLKPVLSCYPYTFSQVVSVL